MAAGNPVDFRSDNTASVSPEIMAALADANRGTAASYGVDEWSRRLDERYGDLFETKVKVFPVATGTAANALALATITRPWGAVYCYETAHVQTSEAGAFEFFSGGAKLLLLPGEGFRLQAARLEAVLATAGIGLRHRAQPCGVTLTQAAEHGTVYRLDEIRAIGAVARTGRLKLHMDGARFANALATLGCSPAEMTWRAGVDILSFGATKNGAMSADAIVVFDQGLVEDLGFRLRRAGQTWSKMRYAAAQLLAYVEDGLYLRSARHANGLARRLADGLQHIEGVRLVAPVEANELFLELPAAAIDGLLADGFLFQRPAATRIRLVCRFDGTEAEVDAILSSLPRHLAQG